MSTKEQAHTAGHTPGPWFVSGVRSRIDGSEWHSINRYNEAKKQDENIAIVGYDPRTGLGLADAHRIVLAVNCHDELVAALKDVRVSIAETLTDHGYDAAKSPRIKILDDLIARATGSSK